VSRSARYSLILGMSLLVLTGGLQAYAEDSTNPIVRQIREQNMLPFLRTPDELKADPIHYKGLVIEPKLQVSSAYNSNVYLSDAHEKGDFVVETAPEITVTKYLGDHSYGLHLKANDRRLLENSGENSTDFSAEARMRLQASQSLHIPFSVSYAKETLDRNGAGRTLVRDITQYDRLRTEGGLDYQFNRLNLKLIGHYERRDFENGRDFSTNALVEYEAKNRDEYGATLVGTYNLAADHAVYAGASYVRQDFDRFTDGTGTETSGLRSNDGLRFMAGFKTRYKDLLLGDIGVGYTLQDYESGQADSVEHFDVAADLHYLVTPKLSFNLGTGRAITQDNDSVRGVLKTHYRLGLDYEFLHDLYGRAETFYEDYEFIDSPLEEDVLGGAVNLRYLHSQRFESQLGLSYRSRESDIQDRDYDQWIFRYGITGRF